MVLLACSARGMVSDKYAPGDVKLCSRGVAAGIYVSKDDFKVVRIAAEALAGDIERVTGKRPAVHDVPGRMARQAVIIGTIGRNPIIDELIRKKKIADKGIRGEWETFGMAVVAKPTAGVDAALVIFGSDRRGTAYGAFELSEEIGVSPWVWWADVTPEKHGTLIVKRGFRRYGPPSVKYRGIFINDEAFGLNPWAAKTFEPETGDIGPKAYAKVFELLLRLKANYLWPAMKKCTRAFNHYPENKRVADDYAIVMGSSHCEPMLRDNPDEWLAEGGGEFDYTVNRDGVLKYWEKRVKENSGYENIYTVGMRGIEDNEMAGGGTPDEKTRRLEQIISDQRELIRKHVNGDVTKIPQLFSPYKEVLDLYRNGLSVPDDVTILWTDDNYGYIRQLPTPEERKRSGGSGIYYHISYSGRPHDYLWLYTTPPALIWEEMHKAYENGARRVWVVNVGDIKPAEIGTELFLRMAWDIGEWGRDAGDTFVAAWARREFGAGHAKDVARIMKEYFLLNGQRKPEHMGFNEIMWPNTVVRDPEFSIVDYGDEAGRRVRAFEEMQREADGVMKELPREKRDAFYQLVLYPVRASNMMNRKMLLAYKSREYAKQGRASANAYAAESKRAYDTILSETDYFNNVVSGGKWKGIMSSRQHDRLVFNEAKTATVKVPADGNLGVAVEGRAKADDAGGNAKLPEFNRFTRRAYFIELFNRGEQPVAWSAEATPPWIKLSKSKGMLEVEERLNVSVDYAKAPKGEKGTGEIRISGGKEKYTVDVGVFNPDASIETGTYVEDNGVVAIGAGGFAKAVDRDGAGWRMIDGLGLEGGAIALLPTTVAPVDDSGKTVERAAYAEYKLFVTSGGKATLIVRAVPTHELYPGRKLRCAVSVDGGKAMFVDFVQGNDENDEIWKTNVLHAAMYGKVETQLSPGAHVLRLYGVDSSVVPDKIFIDFGGMKKSYLGPEETKAH